MKKEQFHIIRAKNAGVFIGVIISTKGEPSGVSCVVHSLRRLYRWVGALDVTMIAKEGVSTPSQCKFSSQLGEEDISTIYDVIETHPVSEKALKNINSVSIWKQ